VKAGYSPTSKDSVAKRRMGKKNVQGRIGERRETQSEKLTIKSSPARRRKNKILARGKKEATKRLLPPLLEKSLSSR
jgi:phage terminase small subunit